MSDVGIFFAQLLVAENRPSRIDLEMRWNVQLEKFFEQTLS